MHTEEEARGKWCPEARVPGKLSWKEDPEGPDRHSAISQNRGYAMGMPLQNTRCIASECMHWRWTPPFATGEQIMAEREGNPLPRTGYCGLSGKP